MLEITYSEFLKDKVHGFRRGRPTKNGVELHIQVQADIKKMIEELRKAIGLSQGEFIDLATFYFAKKANHFSAKLNISLDTTISELFDYLKKNYA